MIGTRSYGELDLMFMANKFGYAAGYERNIGSHISLGVFGNIYFPSTSTIYASGIGYSPANYPNLEFNGGDFKHSGFLLGYESKFYFEPFDQDGPNSTYVGISVQTGTFNQHFANVKYQNKVTYDDESKSFSDQSFKVNRIGIKYGRTVTGALSSDFYFSLMYNMPSNINTQQFIAPTVFRAVSFGIGWSIGVPF